MSVKVDKSSLTKGISKSRKGHPKIDSVSPTTSQVLTIRNCNKTIIEETTKPIKSNGNNTATTSNGNVIGKKSSSGFGNTVVTSARRRKSPSNVRRRREFVHSRRQGGSIAIIDRGTGVNSASNSAELLKRLYSEPDGRAELPNSPKMEYDLCCTSKHPTTDVNNGTARTRNTNNTTNTNNNNTIEDTLHLKRHSLSSPHLMRNRNTVSEQEAITYDIPSECSSLNSSITRTPRAKDRLKMESENATQEDREEEDEEEERQQQLRRQQQRNGSITSPDNKEEMEELTPYDEEDEEEAVQRYMGNSPSMKAIREEKKDSTLLHNPALEVMSQVTSEAEYNSMRRSRTPRSARFRARRFWRDAPRSSSPPRREKQRCHRNNEHVLPDGLSDTICRSLSLYNAFVLDMERKIWFVDDRVLARCLDYIGLMGYGIPNQTQRQPQDQQSQQQQQQSQQPLETIPAEVWGQLVSPIVRVSQERLRAAESAGERSCHWTLNGKASWTATRPKSSLLFLSQQEAERWLSEQEFVIGTILACCACDDRGPACGSEGAVPYLTPMWHPIVQAAAFVLGRFPHWGGVTGFIEMWERQVGIVLGTAAPSHQKLFRFPEENIIFSSDMESGNLARVERMRNAPHQPTYNLWLEPEPGCEQRLWFRFAIAGVRPLVAISLRLVNIQPNTKLYMRNGMRPVWRAGNSPRQWTPVGQCVYRTINNDSDGELTFVIIPRSTDVVQVAFCVPYTYADLLCHICHWHQLVKMSVSGIRFEERVLCYTQDGRKLHLLVITSPTAKGLPTRNKRRGNDGSCAPTTTATTAAAAAAAVLTGGVGSTGTARRTLLGPYSHFDNGKKVILLSARVHPGEVTASHGIHGAISFLLSRDPQAALLREHFVFYIVPMLNADGVARGHSRLDQNGFNLNRCYNNPNPQTQPTVNALRKVFDHLQQTFRERFFMYMDFHSHASQSSGFMFGNFLPMTVQHWNMVFPKIVSLHAKDVFSFPLCRFGKGHMTSKEGSSRVLFGGSLIHSYTVELTHFSNNRMYVDGVNSEDAIALNRPLITGMNTDGESWESRYAITHEIRRRPHNNNNNNNNINNSSNNNNNNNTRSDVNGVTSTSTPAPSRSRSARPRRQQQQAQQLSSSLLAPTPASHQPPPQPPQSKRQNTARRPTDSDNNTHDGVGGRRRRLPLRHIEIPCVLSQSSEVGRACLVALLDYCGIENHGTPHFLAYGGIERTLREVKRTGNATVVAKPPAYRLQFNYKQY
ncbi:zinc carboxypeptidase [Trypanosoma theileri]|uniref:Zinc carboxypeptidase n=1 Tax=Trypanosoma theileri TaxID=67003 RepID=A0A1X0P4K9_9TRYP|nr:zinc carboxypeptidase [Trypanosoma theileri]ORC91380.1 zinc carboxypeptidase [Trypanosoma theileri]